MIAPELFVQQWQKGGLRDVVAPTHAFSFRARQGESALVVTLAPFRPFVMTTLLALLVIGLLAPATPRPGSPALRWSQRA